jgi:glycosyltransferase involved in cell wall biosynthesis
LDRRRESKSHDACAEVRFLTLVVITSIPSPYQVEFFDALARHRPGLRAIYLSRRERGRSWNDPMLRHDAVFLDETREAEGEMLRLMHSAELVVFADYSSRLVREAMRRRDVVDKPWCFWGERPGYHGLGWVGTVWRQIHLAPLYRNHHVPIWGIGKWAIDGYRREFGDSRPYWNIPYFSDLERFRAASAARSAASGTVRILYSGSLIKRKGVDLLANAFRRLGHTCDNVALSLVGTGPLRSLMENVLRPLGPRVRFHDFVHWDDLPRFYAQGDVLCAPSRYDGWGLVIPEGMAAGMPIIATDHMGSALELLEPGRNGWRVRANDENHLYEALQEAVEMAPVRRLAMGRAAQSRSAQQDITEGVQCFARAIEGTMTTWRRRTLPDSSSATLPARTTL